MNNNKKGGAYHGRQLRNRENEVLFVDLRTWNQNIYEKKYVQFSEEQIADVCKIYHDWQTLNTKERPVKYARPELYYSAGLDEIASKNYSLVPSRYIEFVDRDTALDYKTALQTIGAETKELIERHKDNQDKLIKAFETLGYNME